MTETTNANEGRDARGRFTKGNGGGPGNPFAGRMARLRRVLLECVSEQEMVEIAGQLVVMAKFGDLVAIKLLFQYILGKPGGAVDPDAEEFCADGPDSAAAPVGEPAQQKRGPTSFAELLRCIPPAVREMAVRKIQGDAATSHAAPAVPRPVGQPEEARRRPEPVPAAMDPAPSTNALDRSTASNARTAPPPNGRTGSPPSGNGNTGADQCPEVPRSRPRRSDEGQE